MATNPSISTELRHVGPLTDPADTLAPFCAIGLLGSEYVLLVCHHSKRLLHCAMTKANRHIGHPFLMCPFVRSPSDHCAWFCWTNVLVISQVLQAPDV